MPKKRAKNAGGRPKEYEGKMRMVSVSLPEPLIKVLDYIANDAGISRQRLVVETLLLACTLNEQGYVLSDSEGTHYRGGHNKTNLCENPTPALTMSQLAVQMAEMAKRFPNLPCMAGLTFTIRRDAVVGARREDYSPDPGEEWSLLPEE